VILELWLITILLKLLGKGSAIVFITAMLAVSCGYDLIESFDNKEGPSPKNKFFKNNVDFDEGWNEEIVLCE